MSGKDYTTTGLLDAIRAEGRMSEDDTDATDTKLLLLADRVMDRMFVPAVRKSAADFYLTYDDIALVSGQIEYRIPYRAVTSSVRAVVFVDSTGNEFELHPVPLSDRYLYSLATSGYPSVYALTDDCVVLLPTPSVSSGYVRVVYEYTPSKLILPSEAAAIASAEEFGTLDGETTYTIVTDANWSPSAATPADLVAGKAPFSIVARDGVYDDVVPVVGATFTAADRFRAPEEGDYLCPVGESCIPQLPAELHATLALACAAWYLKSIDPQTAKELMEETKESLDMFKGLLTPRRTGRQQKIKSTGSMLRRGAVRKGDAFGNWRP